MLEQAGQKPISLAGQENGEWILMDYDNVVVHIFHEPVRQFYNLEELLSMGKAISVPDDLKDHVRKLRTGMFYQETKRAS